MQVEYSDEMGSWQWQHIHCLSLFAEEEVAGDPFEILYTTLSSQSGAADTKRVMETFMRRRRKNVLGPPVGKVRGGGGRSRPGSRHKREKRQ